MKRRSFVNITAACMSGILACSNEDDAGKSAGIPENKDVPGMAKNIHDSILVLDSHNDVQSEYVDHGLDLGQRIEERQVDLVKMDEGGLDAQFFIVWTPQGELTDEDFAEAYDSAIRYFNAIRTMCLETNADRIELALSPDDIMRIWKSGKKAAMIGVENGYPIGLDIGRVQEFFNLGAQYMTITHMGFNQLGDSSDPRKDIPARKHGGLTDFGKKVVREMNRLGMMVDISHVSRDTFYDTVFTSEAPVIASHSGCRALCDVPRNLDDYQLRAVRDSSGVVQLVAYNGYVRLPKEEANLGYFVDHIDHAVDVIGINHVGIGADFDGGGGFEGFQDASECMNVTVELVRRGYSHRDIEKIWGGNLLRVWRDVDRKSGRVKQANLGDTET